MADPFSAALAALHRSAIAVAAVYTPAGGQSVSLRVARLQGTKEADGFLLDTDQVQIQRADVAQPQAGDRLSIGADAFLIQGGARLDTEGLTWTCYLEPA